MPGAAARNWSFVSLKHFYVLESVLMTQSISGDNAAVPAFTGVSECMCMGETSVMLYTFHPTVCIGTFGFLN